MKERIFKAMKKFLAVLLSFMMIAACLASCGLIETGDPTDTNEDTTTGTTAESTTEAETIDEGELQASANFQVPAGGYDGSAVTITFYHTMGENLRTVLDDYIAEFNKIYPQITVSHKQVGKYDDVRDQITNEIMVGEQPNLAYCYPDHVAMYNVAGVVAQLDALITSTESDYVGGQLGFSDEQKADFMPGYYNEGRQFASGHMYTLPFSKSTEVLYYNKTFFEANGLQPPKTWDELEALCKRIKEIDPNCIPLGYDSEANWFITMCEQYDSPYTSATGEHFLFDNQTNRDFVKKFKSWYDKGYLTTQELYGNYTSGLFVNQDSSTAKSYMSIGSSAGATHQRPEMVDGKYPFEVGITTIPQINAESPKVISQGPSICIFKNDNPQEVIASWLLVKFLTTSVEFQAEFSMASGYVPVIKSVENNEVYADFIANADGGNNIAALSAKVCLEQADAYYTSPAFNGSSKARDKVGELMVTCLSTEMMDIDREIKTAFEKAVNLCKTSK